MNTNPYAPPQTEQTAELRSPRDARDTEQWRWIPATLIFLLGLLALLVAVAGMVELRKVTHPVRVQMLNIAIGSLVAVAAALLTAAYGFWSRRYLFAGLLSAVGIATPFVLRWIFHLGR